MVESGGKEILKAKTTLFLYIAVSIASLGGLIYGYDLAGIAGAILFIKKEFSLSPFSQELVLSSVLFGAMVGAALGGKLCDKLGRRKILIVCAVISFIGVLGTVLANSVLLLILARIVVGAAFGVLSFAVPLYISEMSAPTNRGRLVSIFVIAILSGVLISYLVDYAFSAYSQWRIMFAVGLIPALLLFVGMFFLPESPRWLIKHGYDEKARDILTHIRGTGEIDKEVSDINNTLELTKPDWRELFAPVIKPALVLGLGLAMIRQLTGLSLATFYAPTIFELAGFHSASTAILQTVGVGIVFVIMSIVAMNVMDKLGRRPTMLLGLAGMCIALIVMGISFYLQKSAGGLLGYLTVASLIFFVAAWTIGPGTVVQLVISEIYPLSVRAIAMSVVTAVIWATYLIVTLTFLSLIEALGRPDTFWLYAVLCVVSFAYVYYYMPETKGLSLEEIEEHWHKGKSTQ